MSLNCKPGIVIDAVSREKQCLITSGAEAFLFATSVGTICYLFQCFTNLTKERTCCNLAGFVPRMDLDETSVEVS